MSIKPILSTDKNIVERARQLSIPIRPDVERAALKLQEQVTNLCEDPFGEHEWTKLGKVCRAAVRIAVRRRDWFPLHRWVSAFGEGVEGGATPEAYSKMVVQSLTVGLKKEVRDEWKKLAEKESGE
jgi:hypothetical protein